MLLSECKLTEVIKVITDPDNIRIGHIIGLAENSTKEVIARVKLSNGDELSIHPTNLEQYKE